MGRRQVLAQQTPRGEASETRRRVRNCFGTALWPPGHVLIDNRKEAKRLH